MTDYAAKRILSFKHTGELEDWLSHRPREEAIVIAARAALRVLPIPEEGNSRLMSAKFRATALARVVAKYPKNSTEFRKAAKAFIARATYASASFIAAFAAADAACYPFDPSRIVARAAARATDANAAVWRSVELDADFLAQGGSTSAIADRQLWPEGAPRNLSDFWSELKAELLARDEDWDVWTRWYDERIEGKPSRGEAYELVFANIPIEVWNDDFTAANKWIKEHLPKALDPVDLSSLESLPEQILAAVQFSEGGAGPIDLARDPASELAEQREHYEAARRKALEFSALTPNVLGDLREPMVRLLEAMPVDMQALSINRLWSRANTLRKRLAAHDDARERQQKSALPEPDPALLPPSAAETLRDVVETYNIFIVGDEKGRELDRKRLGPGERERGEQALAAMAPVVAVLPNTPEVATQAVPEILEEKSEAAKSAPHTLAGDQDVAVARASMGNFVLALLRKAGKLVKDEAAFGWKGVREGAYREIGKVALAAPVIGGVAYKWPAIVQFVAKNADALKHFARLAFNNPAVEQMIDAILKLI